ncbi:MAG: hypothetical protein IJQ17_02835 [Oscillospiraceae bacterium]|nr:hypothetical protein [Oscillospiraceae bacterium]
MTALYIVVGLLAVLFGFSRLRLGVRVQFGESLAVAVKIGPKSIAIIPKPERKPQKPKAEKPKQDKPASAKPGKKTSRAKMEFWDIWELVKAVWLSVQRALRATGKRIRIDPLHLTVIFGGDDPCVVAEMYGAACSGMWSVMPRLEQLAQLPNPEIHLGVDFTADGTRSEGDVGIFFRVGDFFAIGASAAGPLIRWFIRFQGQKKNASGEITEETSAAESKTA